MNKCISVYFYNKANRKNISNLTVYTKIEKKITKFKEHIFLPLF